jgi:hypothetical protein
MELLFLQMHWILNMVVETQTKLVPLSVARKRLFPANSDGRPINPSTLWRWIRKGLEGLDGERIRLEVVYRGNAPYVEPEAVQRFFDAVTQSKLERTRRTLQRTADVTDAELAAAGLIGGRS